MTRRDRVGVHCTRDYEVMEGLGLSASFGEEFYFVLMKKKRGTFYVLMGTSICIHTGVYHGAYQSTRCFDEGECVSTMPH